MNPTERPTSANASAQLTAWRRFSAGETAQAGVSTRTEMLIKFDGLNEKLDRNHDEAEENAERRHEEGKQERLDMVDVVYRGMVR
jgi:hypothetical protein